MSVYPLPPPKLVRRVGWDLHARDPIAVYEQRGYEHWRLIKSLLPEQWSFAGKRVLDFGCGAGRIVRHALSEDPVAEYWACDIDAASVAWMQTHLVPPLRAFQSAERPPTPCPEAGFDLIYAFSVFTHLLDSWSAWLLELHRLLDEHGMLIATVFGPGISAHGEVPIGEQITGMNVLHPGTAWDAGGPLIVHSQWWLRAHWGRAFEILELRPGEPSGSPPLLGQSVLVMRKRGGRFSESDLERIEPGEPRELAAARQNVASLRYEVEQQAAEIATFASSRSWQMTGPLRALATRARATTPRDLLRRGANPRRGASRRGRRA
jgi:SAM-dependent methyltransferase